MRNGVSIRKNSIAASALIGSIGGSVLEIVAGDVFSNYLSNYINSEHVATSILVRVAALLAMSVAIFTICVLVIKFMVRLSSQSKFVRKVFFKEKIIEGKWFERVYYDAGHKHLFCLGVVDTYYNENGDLMYSGTDYDYKAFKIVGSFDSARTFIEYDQAGNEATMFYIYDFRTGGVSQNGYGQIVFSISNNKSENHHGEFYNCDGKTYYFEAELIRDKDTVNALNKGGREAQHIIASYFDQFKKVKDVVTDGAIKVIADIYNNDPYFFDEFARYEDCDNNLAKYFDGLDIDGKTVLDVGTGTGRFAYYVIDRAARIVCTDASEKMISFLEQSLENDEYLDKCSCICCDHLMLPHVLKGQKFDLIIAGFTLGCLLGNDHLDLRPKKSLFSSILKNFKKLLAPDGTIIIVETQGIGRSASKIELLSFDAGMEDYYKLLDSSGFDKQEITTDFKFNKHEDANRIISRFWGREGEDRIVYNKQTREWILHEKTGVWRWPKP